MNELLAVPGVPTSAPTDCVIHRSLHTQKTRSLVGNNVVHNQNILKPFRNRIEYCSSSDCHCCAFVRRRLIYIYIYIYIYMT
jgi:hypothetical protein